MKKWLLKEDLPRAAVCISSKDGKAYGLIGMEKALNAQSDKKPKHCCILVSRIQSYYCLFAPFGLRPNDLIEAIFYRTHPHLLRRYIISHTDVFDVLHYAMWILRLRLKTYEH
ncbi:hypothetical protein N9854_00970 [Amylibacter sp.]|nr:hypothetical protein [Amylibacter sp.]